MFCLRTLPRTVFIRLLLLSCCFAGLSTAASAQALPVENEELPSLDAGFRQMYNLDFSAAHQTFEAWQRLQPTNPMGPAANAAAHLFSEFARLHILEIELFTNKDKLKKASKPQADPVTKASFEGELAKADRLATEALARNRDDRDALFARVLSDGLRGNYAALIEKDEGKALKSLKASRSTAEKLLAMDPEYHDANLAIGLENYLLGVRSAPVRWMLKLSGGKTNKKEGIARLKITADKGHLLAPYAQMLLAIAAVRDKDNSTAIALLTGLARDFPHNPLYRSELVRLQHAD